MNLDLPDIPKWFYFNALIQNKSCEVFSSDQGYVLQGTKYPIICIYESPPFDDVKKALSNISEPDIEIITGLDNLEYLKRHFPTWNIEIANMYTQENHPLWKKKGLSDHVRPLKEEEISDIEPSNEDIIRELRRCNKRIPIFAYFDEGKPVSFSFVTLKTKNYCDIAVFTLSGHMNKGYAFECSKALICQINQQKKRPLWGCAHSNKPSKKLANKLELVLADQIYLVMKKQEMF